MLRNSVTYFWFCLASYSYCGIWPMFADLVIKSCVKSCSALFACFVLQNGTPLNTGVFFCPAAWMPEKSNREIGCQEQCKETYD